MIRPFRLRSAMRLTGIFASLAALMETRITLTRRHAEWVLVILIPVAVFVLASQMELSERIGAAAVAYEFLQLDELPVTLLSLAATLAWISWRNNRRAALELQRRLDAEAALAAKQQEFQLLSRRSTAALETERRKLAQELHDDLGQMLNAIKIEAVSLRDSEAETAAPNHRGATAIIRLADRSYEGVRRLLRRLRPVALDELGLQGALEHALADWRERSPAIDFILRGASQLPAFDEAAAIALYRVCQEGITNALRHAAPSQIVIAFTVSPENTAVHLSIRDNGNGADLVALRHGLGLLGMRERIEGIGGQIHFSSTPGAGFAILAEIPCQPRAPTA